MLTILSTPKAFDGIFEVIQTNAITSWRSLRDRPEVILFGDDDGTAEVAARVGARHVPDVARTPEGTPLLSDMFLRGQELASHDVVCWSNADVMFTDRIAGLAEVVRRHPRPLYAVGRRTDIDVTEHLAFDDGWQQRLVERAAAEGERKPLNWIDWFMFPRGLFRQLPPFAIGRPGYDQWLIWRAAELGADVVDATEYLLAVHQRHDYSHVGGRAKAFRGAEAQRNQALVDHWRHFHTIGHARLKLDADGNLAAARDLSHLLARPRRAVAHALRFTVPLRQRMLGERATRRSRRPPRSPRP